MWVKWIIIIIIKRNNHIAYFYNTKIERFEFILKIEKIRKELDDLEKESIQKHSTKQNQTAGVNIINENNQKMANKTIETRVECDSRNNHILISYLLNYPNIRKSDLDYILRSYTFR